MSIGTSRTAAATWLARWTAGSRAADTMLVAAVLIAGSVSRHAVYTDYGVVILVASVAAIAAAVAAWPAARWGAPSRAAILLGIVLAFIAEVIKPPYMNVDDTTNVLHAGVLVCEIATVLAAVLLVAPRRFRAPVCWTALAATLVSYLMVVRGSTRPRIDVWTILQGASIGVVHGHNPYNMVFTGGPPGQVNNAFNYLPMTFLLPVPARLLAGDVRYGEAVALFAGALAIGALSLRAASRHDPARSTGPAPRAVAPVLAVLAGVLPGSLYDVQQAWNETILFGALAAAAVLVAVRRPGWAMVGLVIALTTKQHVLLLLPLWALWPAFGWRRAVGAGTAAGLIMLPWVLADFSRFRYCVVDFFLNLPARTDSLSVWKLIPEPLRTPAVLALTVAAYLLVLRRLPRNAGGLLLGSGLVLAAFDLANKQSFLNQWLLAAQLVIGGLALVAAEPGQALQATGSTVGEETPTPPTKRVKNPQLSPNDQSCDATHTAASRVEE